MKVYLTKQAKKQLNKLPHKERSKILKRLLALEEERLTGKRLTGKLSAYHSIRAYPYRIIFIRNKKDIQVVTIGHRQGVYK